LKEIIPQIFLKEDLAALQVNKIPEVVEMVNHILDQGIEEEASDIHFEPKKKNVIVRFRKDGDLFTYKEVEHRLYIKLLSRIKVLSKMNIADFRNCQDGKMEYISERNNQAYKVDVRISIIPTIFGEKMVMRLLDQQKKYLQLHKLGFTPTQLKMINDFVNFQNGMLLCVGPTGSGKTSTLYSILQQFDHQQLNITSIEDPIEYQIENINQCQINEKTNVNFHKTIKYVLRQDPDVIMIGEIRDEETAKLAVRATITGHRVLSTLHTKNAISTVVRLIDMGVQPYYLNSALNGIIGQRLLKKNCPFCSIKVIPTEEEMELLGGEYPGNIMIGQGCKVCNQKGTTTRVLVAEVLLFDDRVKDLIRRKTDRKTIRKELGIIHKYNLVEQGKSLLFSGIIPFSEYRKLLFTDEF